MNLPPLSAGLTCISQVFSTTIMARNRRLLYFDYRSCFFFSMTTIEYSTPLQNEVTHSIFPTNDS